MSPSLPYRLLRPALIAAGTLAALPAAAQFYGGYPPPYVYNSPPPPYSGYGDRRFPDAPRVSPGAVVDRLEDQGYEDIGRPRFTGTLYLVEATAPGGMRVRVAVDAVRGVILNRTALGYRGGREIDEDEDGDRVPRRRSGGRPAAPEPDEMPDRGYGGRAEPRNEEYRERREASRPSTDGPLPAPTDPRLIPAPGASRDAEPREAPRAAPRPGASSSPERPYGVNPDTIPSRRKPSQQARRPAGEPSEIETRPLLPPAATTSPEPRSGSQPAPAARASAQAKPGPERPVRVIEGVTPMNGGGAPAQPDNLPVPRAAPPAAATE